MFFIVVVGCAVLGDNTFSITTTQILEEILLPTIWPILFWKKKKILLWICWKCFKRHVANHFHSILILNVIYGGWTIIDIGSGILNYSKIASINLLWKNDFPLHQQIISAMSPTKRKFNWINWFSRCNMWIMWQLVNIRSSVFLLLFWLWLYWQCRTQYFIMWGSSRYILRYYTRIKYINLWDFRIQTKSEYFIISIKRKMFISERKEYSI